MDFDALVYSIGELHHHLHTQAAKAINVSLTLRNWLIGAYIVEFEQRGDDRATYGEHLLELLADNLQRLNISTCDRRRLSNYRQFFLTYPQMSNVLTADFAQFLGSMPPDVEIWRSLTAKSPKALHFHDLQIWRSPTAKPMEQGERMPSEPMPTTPAGELQTSPRLLLDRLSYTHFEQIIQLDNPLKRAFYEIECIKGGWSVRELKRQIASLYYERSALSRDKEALSRLAQEAAETSTPTLAIRDPYVFEFLGLKPSEAMRESDLADALLDKLQDFLLELGRGSCFEARQRRILLGGEHFFVDLVFYHRIVKCHVLIELKIDGFKHEYLGQLNTYVTWFREHEMAEDDNPPVGILLCTDKNHALVKYALAGMDNRLFVSKYEFQLPDEADIRAFLEEQYRQLQGHPPQFGDSTPQVRDQDP